MAIRTETIDLMDIGCEAIGSSFKGLKICELGNQHTKDCLKYKTSKEYLMALGAEHISIDLNGEDGALKIDLSTPIIEFKEHFDMVTNYGTSEHVMDQYMVFKNIHNLIRCGGVMIHALPLYDYWMHHGFYNYQLCFFDKLSQYNDYKIILNESRIKKEKVLNKDLYYLCNVCIKTRNNDFVEEGVFRNIEGLKSVR